MFDRVEHALGPIRALVCNAGVGREAVVADATEEDIRRIVAINALGLIWCAREAIRWMSTTRGGSGDVIVNVSSIAAVFGGLPGDVVYAASSIGSHAWRGGKRLGYTAFEACRGSWGA